MNTEEQEKNFLTEGLLIAYVSILGYLTAFGYEYGYLSFFKIPSSFIELNLTAILISVSAVAGGLTVCLMSVQLLSFFGVFQLKSAFGRSIKRISILFIMLLSYLILANFRNALIIGITFAIFLFFELIFPFITQRKLNSIEEKFLAQEEVEQGLKKNDLIFFLVQKYRTIATYIVFGLVVISISIIKGESAAINQTSFLVSDNLSELLIIRSYETRHIGLEYDPESKLTKNRFILLNSDQLGVVNLMNLGKLKPAE